MAHCVSGVPVATAFKGIVRQVLVRRIIGNMKSICPDYLYLAHRTCIDALPSPLKLTEGNAVLFAPLDGHLPKFDLLKSIPSVPQVVFRK
jgi:hypothetical protein